MKYRVEIADKSFNRLEILDQEAMGLHWDFSRIGGCGSFSFDLPREYCNERFISGDFNVKIYKRNNTTKAYDLWYQGLVETKQPNIRGGNETIQVRGTGYQAQLSRIYIANKIYTSTEVSLIVKDILDTYVCPYTNITYSGGDLVATGFTPSTVKFNTDALSAMQTLADITGTREWGVDANRKFYFKERSSAVGFIYPIGSEKILNFSSDDSFKDIINRVVIQGGDVAGVPYTATFNDTSSQLKYNLRTSVTQNSSITTSDVATQYANSVFTESRDVVRRGSCELLEEIQIESTTPIPLFLMLAPSITYGQKAYGTFLYAGRITYQVNRINYSVDNNGNMRIGLELGQLRPTLSEKLAQLNYELEQLRSTSL